MAIVTDTKSNVKLITESDLAIATWLVQAGCPLVLGHRRRGHAFALEPDWPQTPANLRNYYRWLGGEGDLLAIITGKVYDVFDFDVQNGGSLSEYLTYLNSLGHKQLTVQAISATPSGGFHVYVNTLGKRKCPIARGIDYQGKAGIAFIPPSRKLSKQTNEPVSYRWLDYSPGGNDDGNLMYTTISAWPGHRPVLSKATRSSTESSVLTKADITRMMKEGLPPDCNHDDTLKQIVWMLVLWHRSEEDIRRVWTEIVSRTEEKGGKRAFEEERDLERHKRGAQHKLSRRNERFAISFRTSSGSRVTHRIT